MAWGMRNIKIALFGSSIMEGRIGVEKAINRYYSILQRNLSERFPEVCFSILNGSVGGWSTRELMENFEDYTLKYEPDYCIVMIGANNNDLNHPQRIVKKEELLQLMEDFQTRLPGNCQRLGVILNPVINEKHWCSKHPTWQEAFKKQNYKGLNEMLEPEREMVREFYNKYDYPVVDLAKLMAAEPERYICDDGIHLSPEGHALFANALFETMVPLLIKNGHDTNGR